MNVIQTVGGYRDEKGHHLEVYRRSGMTTFRCSICKETIEEITKEDQR